MNTFYQRLITAFTNFVLSELSKNKVTLFVDNMNMGNIQILKLLLFFYASYSSINSCFYLCSYYHNYHIKTAKQAGEW